MDVWPIGVNLRGSEKNIDNDEVYVFFRRGGGLNWIMNCVLIQLV